ncbi:unnamed protein product [Eruca vesicaria subsp. sativa]|uniref:RRM domain-containing protein n=1 Tax=Eruca vesicaria subsp. sativa TaxID=29727 RepID=A0ABC8J566_ERUVS|nr:unnamed protein product [Eruca vesicaria subsp. sativa]
MDGGLGESSSGGEKPVIVRVKRKVGQSPLDAIWLEINERPFKRPLLDFSNLSISNSGKKVVVDVRPKKVLVRHLETVTDSETTVDIIHSLFESDNNEQSCSKGKLEDRKLAFRKDNRKEQRLTKAVQQQQTAAQNARFEQIWRRRNGNKEGIHDKELHERCSFYDVIRVDTEERPNNAPEVTSLEDQKMLASFLPLLRDCIPTAAEEIEADIHASHTEEYVYDFYAVNEEMDISEDSSKHQFPLVIVEEEEEFYDGPDESDYDSEDSNEEESEEESEEEEEEEDEESEEEKSEASDESKDEETSKRHLRMVLDEEDEEFLDGYDAEDVNVYGDSDEEFEQTKWCYRLGYRHRLHREAEWKMLTADIPPNQSIYIKNLNEKVKKEELKRSLYCLFSQFGRILDVVALKTPKLRGQAWVAFSDVTSATNAVRQMQNFPFYDKPMRIQFAKEKSDCIAKEEGTFVPKDKKKRKQEEKAERKREETQRPNTANGPTPQNGAPPAPSSFKPSGQEAMPPNNILFIQNLPHNTTTDMLEYLFSQYPGFKEIRMVAAKPGIAFAEFEDDVKSSMAMQGLQDFKITPQFPMLISFAKK